MYTEGNLPRAIPFRGPQNKTSRKTAVEKPEPDRLSKISTSLSLVHTACQQALKGVTRISVSELVGVAREEANAYVTAPVAGQILSSLGVATTTSHGRNRLVLDYAQLDAIREDLLAELDELTPLVEAQKSRHAKLQERLALLNQRSAEVQSMVARINELSKLLEKRPEIRQKLYHVQQLAKGIQ